jgi:hypothetical protein
LKNGQFVQVFLIGTVRNDLFQLHDFIVDPFSSASFDGAMRDLAGLFTLIGGCCGGWEGEKRGDRVVVLRE